LSNNKGIAYLVGAGPGDPSLLTLKGLWCLEKADVVVYDRLVGEYQIAFCRSDAELIYVGKQTDRHTLPQSGINQLLADLVRQGKTVCRLKGGDPFVFGRGGEEAAFLAKEGLPFEVVPGVTAAVAVPSYAGIPVTHRDCASSFTVATGHRRYDRDVNGHYSHLVPGEGETMVFLMGYENLEAIVSDFIKNGQDSQTPAALIHWGTRAEQKTVVGTLQNIQERARLAGLAPPSILVIGSVVELRQALLWREKLPLFGKRILITRPIRQAHDFARRIIFLGGEPLCLPTIEVVAPSDPAPLDRALAELAVYDWVIFTSVNGVAFFFERIRYLGFDVRELRGKLAAIGPATAMAIRKMGLLVAYQPDEYRAEQLLQGLLGAIPSGSRVLLPRAESAREILVEGLRAAGIVLDMVPAYKTISPGDKYKSLIEEQLISGRIHIITFTSSSTVTNFFELFGRERAIALAARSHIACIGPITAATARQLGLQVARVATEYTTDGLLNAIASGTM